MKHTLEPWKVWNHDGDACIEALIIEPDIYGDISTSLSFANAERIVACINACAGMEDPETEIQALRMDLADYIAQHHCQVQQRARLKADAEMMAEAMKEIIANDEIHEKLINHETPAQRIARAALKAHEELDGRA